MEIKRLRFLPIEIFKTVNNLNTNYMKDVFTPKLHPKARPNDVLVKHHNAITYSTKTLKTLGSKIWNHLPVDIKSETSYSKFKEYIDTWFEPKCRRKFVLINLRYLKCVLITYQRAVMYFKVFADALVWI